MKRELILLTFLTVTSLTFSQSIQGDSVHMHKNQLKAIIKQSRKCDSLKVAYNFKSQLLDSLLSSNFTMFKDLQIEQDKQKTLQVQLNQKNDELFSVQKKPFGNINSLLTGGLIGALIVALIVIL